MAYRSGRGVKQNYEEAVKWLRKAAEQGHARALDSLGSMYSQGDGVEKNYEEAVKWLEKFVEQRESFGKAFAYGFTHCKLKFFLTVMAKVWSRIMKMP
jgi:TPR repeat protein